MLRSSALETVYSFLQERAMFFAVVLLMARVKPRKMGYSRAEVCVASEL